MTSIAVETTQPGAQRTEPTRRRSLLLGAGVAGAAAVAAKVLPIAPTEMVAAPLARPAPEAGGGYRLSQHVLRYYETTKV